MERKEIDDNHLYKLINKYKKENIPLAIIFDKYIISNHQKSIFLNEVLSHKSDIKDNAGFEIVNEVYNTNVIRRDLTGLLFLKLKDIRKELAILERNHKDNSSLHREFNYLKEQIIIANINVVKLAISYFFNNINLPLEDAQMYGIEGLIKALNDFDYKKQVSFQAFAIPYIVENIKKYFYELVSIRWEDIKINKSHSINYWNNIINKQLVKTSHDVDIFSLGVDTTDMLFTEEAYLEQDEYEDQHYLEDQKDYYAPVISDIAKKDIVKAMCVLNKREKEVIINLYGLVSGIEKTYAEVAEMLSLSEGYVKNIERKALTRLKNSQSFAKVKDYYEGREVGSLRIKSFRKFVGLKINDDPCTHSIMSVYEGWSFDDYALACKIFDHVVLLIEEGISKNVVKSELVQDILINKFYSKYFDKNMIHQMIKMVKNKNNLGEEYKLKMQNV